MRWGVGLLPGRQVASRISAIRRGYRQSIVVADVARNASRVGMGIGQREASCSVIENSRGPGGDRVARGTLRRRGREPGRDVVRYVPANCRGALEIRLVAPITVRRIECVVVAQMAGGAERRRRGHVRSGQGKPRGAMVKRCGCKTQGRVASGTVPYRKCGSGDGVRRGVGPLPGRQVAA
jgi:hypothetical protein